MAPVNSEKTFELLVKRTPVARAVLRFEGRRLARQMYDEGFLERDEVRLLRATRASGLENGCVQAFEENQEEVSRTAVALTDIGDLLGVAMARLLKNKKLLVPWQPSNGNDAG